MPRALGRLRPHEDANLVQLLPFAVEREQGANFEETCCNVERRRDLCPFPEVADDFPFFVAVVDDEKIAAALRIGVLHIHRHWLLDSWDSVRGLIIHSGRALFNGNSRLDPPPSGIPSNGHPVMTSADAEEAPASTARQNTFTSCISSRVEHRVRARPGLPTTTARVGTRQIATFSRFLLNRKAPRHRSARLRGTPREVHCGGRFPDLRLLG